MSELAKLHRAPSLHHTVQEALKDFIVHRQLSPGDPLPAEAELARQLGVGRNSVREAVKSLETVGVIESRRGSGLFVGRFSFDPLLDALPYGLMIDSKELTDLLDVRGALEVAMVPKAIAVRSDAQIATLHEVLGEMHARAAAGASFSAEDRRFHRELFAQVGNHVLLRLIDVFWKSFHRAARDLNLGNATPLATYEDHAAILDAFERGQVEETKDTLDRHYDGIRALLRGGDRGEGSTRLAHDAT
ncbi:MAG: FadR/GntR family transcriptional regulator [Myxococcota bacterium]